MLIKMFFGLIILVAFAFLGTGIFRNTLASTNQMGTEMQSNKNNPSNILEPYVEVDNWQEENADQNIQIDRAYSKNEQVEAIDELSEAEEEGLLFMYEEEKLARDVYKKLYGTWQLQIFHNIAGSEQTHMDAVKGIIDRNNLSDADFSQPGTYSNPDLQMLYDELITRGSQSMEEALRVGAVIEEIDILDLQKHIAQTNNPEIQNVYKNLLRGSQNHLGAFTRMLLNKTNRTYQPQFMSKEEYQVATSRSNQGMGNGKGGIGRQGGKWDRGGSQ